LIGETLPATLSNDERERKAIAIFSVMMGALQLARLSSDPEQSDRCLEAGLEAALKLAGKRVPGRNANPPQQGIESVEGRIIRAVKS